MARIEAFNLSIPGLLRALAEFGNLIGSIGVWYLWLFAPLYSSQSPSPRSALVMARPPLRTIGRLLGSRPPGDLRRA
jgi:hypothetical protein